MLSLLTSELNNDTNSKLDFFRFYVKVFDFCDSWTPYFYYRTDARGASDMSDLYYNIIKQVCEANDVFIDDDNNSTNNNNMQNNNRIEEKDSVISNNTEILNTEQRDDLTEFSFMSATVNRDDDDSRNDVNTTNNTETNIKKKRSVKASSHHKPASPKSITSSNLHDVSLLKHSHFGDDPLSSWDDDGHFNSVLSIERKIVERPSTTDSVRKKDVQPIKQPQYNHPVTAANNATTATTTTTTITNTTTPTPTTPIKKDVVLHSRAPITSRMAQWSGVAGYKKKQLPPDDGIVVLKEYKTRAEIEQGTKAELSPLPSGIYRHRAPTSMSMMSTDSWGGGYGFDSPRSELDDYDVGYNDAKGSEGGENKKKNKKKEKKVYITSRFNVGLTNSDVANKKKFTEGDYTSYNTSSLYPASKRSHPSDLKLKHEVGKVKCVGEYYRKGVGEKDRKERGWIEKRIWEGRGRKYK
jgi:hypothetical protein